MKKISAFGQSQTSVLLGPKYWAQCSIEFDMNKE